ncbi:MAG: hypothetical protein JNN08_11465 [Bryobacterales bacterium]|nr:hypothetical protein [Bryobacterales bacterium]
MNCSSKIGGSGQEQFQILALQFRDQALVLADDGGGEFALGVLELEDFLFYGVARDEAATISIP